MKSILYLVVQKQWKSYLLLSLLIAGMLLTCFIMQQKINAVFRMPIAVQDLDHSQSSESLIAMLKNNHDMTVKIIGDEESFIEDRVKAKEAVISLSIPEGFNEQVKQRSLRDTIQLYYRDDFIGAIAQEIVSKTLFEAQIPYIVKYHIDKERQVNIEEVKKMYYQKTPESRMKQITVSKSQDRSISLSTIFALILFVSSVQVILHHRLKQNAALERMYMFNKTKLFLHIIYITIHTVIIMLSIIIAAAIMNQMMSVMFYCVCLLFTLIFECVISLLLFKINTTSHRLFMTITFTLVLVTIYMLQAIGGNI